MVHKVWNMQFLDGGHWDADPQKCVFGEVYKKVISCLEDFGSFGCWPIVGPLELDEACGVC